ncbi:hypothetical protein CRYUN_Cryun05aG0132700 [Craigia yunnanensis]
MSNYNAIANGVAGAGAGIIAQILTYPLQTVNTRQQTERIAKKSKPSAASAPAGTGTGTLLQILHGIYQLFKNKAEAIAAARKHKGRGDGTVGIFSWLLVAALAGSNSHPSYAIPI